MNKQEHTCTYPLNVEVAHLNERCAMKPASYQNLFAMLAERHLQNYQADFSETTKYNYAWVLISISIEMVKPINSCVKLFASTWFSKRRGPYFRRELVFRDESGATMFHGSTHSVLLDVEKRSVYRKKAMPFPMTEPHEEFCIEADPAFKETRAYRTADKRIVRNSHLDCLGHVNNCRYGEFAYDALDNNEKKRIESLKRMDLFFLSELREGERFLIQKSKDEDSIFIRGQKMTEETAFHINFYYK